MAPRKEKTVSRWIRVQMGDKTLPDLPPVGPTYTTRSPADGVYEAACNWCAWVERSGDRFGVNEAGLAHIRTHRAAVTDD